LPFNVEQQPAQIGGARSPYLSVSLVVIAVDGRRSMPIAGLAWRVARLEGRRRRARLLMLPGGLASLAISCRT